MRFADLYLWFLLYSVVGWVYESLLFTVYCRRPVNRGFLTGPFLPLYGSGGVMVVALFYGRIEHPAAIFFLSLVLTTALEYLTAVVMENLFQAKWWDYSKFPLNYKGRISVISSLVFAAMALLTLRYVHPHVERLTSLIPPLHKHLILALATIALLVDLTITIRHVFILNGRLREIHAPSTASSPRRESRRAACARTSCPPSRRASLHRTHQDALPPRQVAERAPVPRVPGPALRPLRRGAL